MNHLKSVFLPAAIAAAIALPISASAQDGLKEIAAQLLGDKFGVPVEQILQLAGQSNEDVYELAPTYALSRQTRRPAREVYRLRNQGLGWGEVAHRLGMHPGTFNKMRNAGAFDRDRIWSSIYQNHYGTRASDIAAIRNRGGSQRDILPAILIARSKHARPTTVFDRYRKDRDWNRTASSYKVDFRHNRGGWVPLKTSRGEDHSKWSRPRLGIPLRGHEDTHWKGSGPGRWNGKGHEKENGHGNGHHKDHDNGKGHGNGHGHGGGNGHGNGHHKGD